MNPLAGIISDHSRKGEKGRENKVGSWLAEASWSNNMTDWPKDVTDQNDSLASESTDYSCCDIVERNTPI